MAPSDTESRSRLSEVDSSRLLRRCKRSCDRDQPVQIDMFERLPTPYGLVRSRVAPDHQKLKQPIMVFEQIARAPNFRFIGNVEIGRDVSVDDLRTAYNAGDFCLRCRQNDRRMGIPGEDLKGSHTATEFVGWYNGHH